MDKRIELLDPTVGQVAPVERFNPQAWLGSNRVLIDMLGQHTFDDLNHYAEKFRGRGGAALTWCSERPISDAVNFCQKLMRRWLGICFRDSEESRAWIVRNNTNVLHPTHYQYTGTSLSSLRLGLGLLSRPGRRDIKRGMGVDRSF